MRNRWFPYGLGVMIENSFFLRLSFVLKQKKQKVKTVKNFSKIVSMTQYKNKLVSPYQLNSNMFLSKTALLHLFLHKKYFKVELPHMQYDVLNIKKKYARFNQQIKRGLEAVALRISNDGMVKNKILFETAFSAVEFILFQCHHLKFRLRLHSLDFFAYFLYQERNVRACTA